MGKNTVECRTRAIQEEQLLAEHDEYIVALARKKILRNAIHPESLADDIEELAQKIRVKLLLVSRKQRILATRAYINRIATTVAIDMVRVQKPTISLTLNEDGELYQGNLALPLSQQTRDPADVLIQEESYQECIERMVEGVLALPPSQQHALLSFLKKRINDLHPFAEALKEHGLDIEAHSWPKEYKELQSLRASLFIARRKMRAWHNRYYSVP